MQVQCQQQNCPSKLLVYQNVHTAAARAEPEIHECVSAVHQSLVPGQSVLIERVATPEVSADWSIAQKSSSSSSISINNGGYYDINNEPLLGTHTLRMGMQEVRKISHFCAPKCVPA